jgi:transposase
MPFKSKKQKICLSIEELKELERITKSRTEAVSYVERAGIILAFNKGETISQIARDFKTNKNKIERCIDRALQFGVLTSLKDLPRSGRKKEITPDAIAWVINLACQKPKDLGYSYELWTNRLLAEYIRKNCLEAGHPCLKEIARGTISKILSKSNIKPHKINYYLEKRDPDFEIKMIQILLIYKEIEMYHNENNDKCPIKAIISYDEKPGIQAIENLAPDLLPQPGKYSTIARDHQYKRHGTVTLMAGINLINGIIHGQVVDRHRSLEFIQFLKLVDKEYPQEIKIRIILDNHSAHISKETRKYLETKPNRFEFIFTPKHGSWLNLIESFFGKMAKTMLRGIRVSSKEELKERILKYLDEINRSPVIFRWKYGLESLSIS